jgi:hypothetical protein
VSDIVETDDCQNPSYPEDRFMTESEIATKARACSLMRANSPGELICYPHMGAVEIPGWPMPGNPNSHTHPYDEFMAFRRNHDPPIGDDDAWMYYLLYDQWAAIAPPGQPEEPFPNPPVGWNPRVRVNPRGISQMDGLTGLMLGYTFVTKTKEAQPSALVQGGVGTRLTLTGQYETIEAYVSPCHHDFAITDVIFLHRLMVNGNTTFQVNGEVVTDPLPYGIDGSNGFLVTAFVSATPAKLGYKAVEPEWSTRTKTPGNWTTQLDKGGSDWTAGAYASLSLLMIEGYYGPA